MSRPRSVSSSVAVLFAAVFLIGTSQRAGAQILNPQTIDLPARYDLEPSASSDTQAGWTYFAPNRIYASTLSQPFGWQSAPTCTGFTAVIGPIYPRFAEPDVDDRSFVFDLWGDGHTFTEAQTFKARVEPDVTKVRVHVIVGRADEALRGQNVWAAGNAANATEAKRITIEDHPDSTLTSGDGDDGAWARTLGTNGGFDDSLDLGGFRHYWFDKNVTANQVVNVYFEPQQTMTSPEMAVVAIELYATASTSGQPAGADWDVFHAPAIFKLGDDGTTEPALYVDDDYEFHDASVESDFSDGVDDLNAGLLADAIAHFESIDADDDPLARAAGLLWAAGWLDDEQWGDSSSAPTGQPLFFADGYEWDLIDRAINLMLTGNEAGTSGVGPFFDNPYAAEYTYKALRYRRAVVHHMLGDRPRVEIDRPNEGTLSVNNPFTTDEALQNRNVAEAIMRDLVAQDPCEFLDEYIATNTTSTDVRGVRLHPLFFKAAAYLGANWFSRNPISSLGGGPPDFLRQHYRVWKAFRDHELRPYPVGGSVTGPFDESATLGVLQHQGLYEDPDWTGAPLGDADCATENFTGLDLGPGGEAAEGYAYPAIEDGGILFANRWNGEGGDTVFGTSPPALWWDLYAVGSTYPCGNNGWAPEQLRARRALLSVARWWNTERLIDGSYGGGGNDDVELVLLWLIGALPVRGSEDGVNAAMLEVADRILGNQAANGYFPDDGSSDACKSSDAEHNGETVGNPIRGVTSLTEGDPTTLEYAARSTKNVVRPAAEADNQPAWRWTHTIEADDTNWTFVDLLPAPHVDPAKDAAGAGASADHFTLRPMRAWAADASGAVYTNASYDPPFPEVEPNCTPDFNHNGDISMNGRVLQPATFLRNYNRNPKALQLLREWAEFWWYVAMDTGGTLGDTTVASQDKPIGVFPVLADADPIAKVVTYGDPAETNLADRDWWVPPANPGNPSNPEAFGYDTIVQHTEQFYHLFLDRYLDPDTDDDDRIDYLLPVYFACRYVALLEASQSGSEVDELLTVSTHLNDLKGTGTGPGSAGWIANNMKNRAAVLWQLSYALPYLHDAYDAGDLASRLDDFGIPQAGATEPIDLVLEGTRLALVRWGTEVLAAQMATDATAFDVASVRATFEELRTWYETFFPLLSSFVFATDKVFVKKGNGGDNIFTSMTGAALTGVPTPMVTWDVLPDDDGFGDPVSTAFMVEGWDTLDDLDAIWRARVVKFSGADNTFRVRFHPGFRPGTYTFRFAETYPSFDYDFSGGSATAGMLGPYLVSESIDIGVFGGEVEMTVPGVSAGCKDLYLVSLERTGDSTSDTTFIDVGVGRGSLADLDLVDGTPDAIEGEVGVHYLGNVFDGVSLAAVPVTVDVEFSSDSNSGPLPTSWTAASPETGSVSLTPPDWDATDGEDIGPLEPLSGTVAIDVDLFEVGTPAAAPQWVRVTVTLDTSMLSSDDNALNDEVVVIYRIVEDQGDKILSEFLGED